MPQLNSLIHKVKIWHSIDKHFYIGNTSRLIKLVSSAMISFSQLNSTFYAENTWQFSHHFII
ncbi:hypothetical protein Nizo2485_2351 [Lactiplantibacillus plantarum]|nr:hypothetical protein Nizo2485_2351 [Lactiplantibacillus plantarum]